jgi:hypothetical protein
LRKFNVSFNRVAGLISDSSILEEIDYSHNQHGGDWGVNLPFFQLKKLNISNNLIKRVGLYQAPSLTHLDLSNNLLTELDLQNNKNLVALNCSINPFTNLTLPSFSNLNSFDCLGIKFDKSVVNSSVPPTSTTIISPTSATETVFVNNPALTMSLGIPLGISVLG